jgi:4-diphosphocytidyl-2-C-methyl-D-erythritol kinase
MPWIRPVFVPAFAKINLTLEVLGRRTDGYHEIASVMQTVGLCDTLCLQPRADRSLDLWCDVPELSNERNLAWRAAAMLAEELPVQRGVQIEVRKAIPTEGGLAGGSSDGASVLLALAHLWHVQLAPDRLVALAARLGSDVPFFLAGGTAHVTGRGEVVRALPDVEPLWVVLAKPPTAISTAMAFRALQPPDFCRDQATSALAQSIAAGARLPLDRLVNSFESSIDRTTTTVAAARDALHAAGASIVRLSGTGPTLFAPFRVLAEAAAVFERLRGTDLRVWLTHTVTRREMHDHFARLDDAVRDGVP